MRIALATCSKLHSWETDDRPLFAALCALGAEPVAAVWDDPGVRWDQFDACLIRTTWDYCAKHAAFIEWAANVQNVTRLFNPADIVKWNLHKFYLRDLEAQGGDIIPTIWLQRGTNVNLAEIVAAQRWSAGFIKPAIGAAARETHRFTADAGGLSIAQRHIDRLLAREDLLLQPYLRSVECEGEWSAIFIDGEFSHAVRKVPVPGDYRVQDDFGAHDEPTALQPPQLEAARRAVRAVDTHLLYARADFLQGDNGEIFLTELELVEPSLFFRHDHAAADRLAHALRRRIRRDD